MLVRIKVENIDNTKPKKKIKSKIYQVFWKPHGLSNPVKKSMQGKQYPFL